MAKFLLIELKVPMTKEQAEVLTKSDFTSNEWEQLILGAIRSSALNENIKVMDTEIFDDGEDVVVPEETHAWPN